MAGRSHTAQYVAQTRAVLHERGVIDDPYAAAMQSRPMRALTAAMRLPVIRRWNDSSLVTGLGRRIAFFDEQLVLALDEGITQVVVLGAGYDSRAWRFARQGVRFFEVDHPRTQADKRLRAPAGSQEAPVYVPADLVADDVGVALEAGGVDWSEPVVFLIEGVTMYLEAVAVHALLRSLAGRAAPGSRLVVNFGAAPGDSPSVDLRNRALRFLGRIGGEPHRFLLDPAAVMPFVRESGWQVVYADLEVGGALAVK